MGFISSTTAESVGTLASVKNADRFIASIYIDTSFRTSPYFAIKHIRTAGSRLHSLIILGSLCADQTAPLIAFVFGIAYAVAAQLRVKALPAKPQHFCRRRTIVVCQFERCFDATERGSSLFGRAFGTSFRPVFLIVNP